MAPLTRDLVDAAENAYSVMAFTLQDLCFRDLKTEEAMDARAEEIAKAGDRLRAALNAIGSKG